MRWRTEAWWLFAAALVTAACGGGASSSGVAGSGGHAGGSVAGGSGGNPAGTGGGSAAGAAGAPTGGGGATATKRPWPDSSATTRVLADQLPNGMTAGQRQFVVSHMVGTQKLTLAESQPLRALAPNFLVLHYHLAIWQSAPTVSFIIDGNSWGNDYPTVTTHENWFWHNEAGQRVAAVDDGKLLMNIGDSTFLEYWASSIEAQAKASDADAVFADSASPDLLQWEAQNPLEPRLAGTGARDTAIAELSGRSYIYWWELFMGNMDAALGAAGLPLIPNIGSQTTSWDTTDYYVTAGVFVEGFADPKWALADWERSTNRILALVLNGKIVIVQNYLASAGDVATRLYYLANYLLVRGPKTYIDYFAAGPLEWYPEWSIDLGAPLFAARSVAEFGAAGGAYQRDFQKGWAVVNPGDTATTVSFPAGARQIVPVGGGAVNAAGDTPGSIGMSAATSVTLAPHSAAIVLR